MSTETTNKKIKIDNGTTFGRTYTDKAIDAKLPTDLIASANKLSLGVGSTALGNGVNLDGFTYDEATKTLKASGGDDNALIIFDYPTNGKLTDEQFNMLKANPGKYAIRKKTWDKRDQIFLSSADYNPNYNIVYENDIISIQGQTAAVNKYFIALDETRKELKASNTNKEIVADYQKLPQVPSDASTSTYILKLVNGKSTWVKEAA